MAKEKETKIKELKTNIEKEKIDSLIKLINKSSSENVITRLGNGIIKNVETFSSGSFLIDKALGVNGIPRGRIIEIYGPESSGKTTLTLQMIKSIQELGGVAAFIDVEHALDPVYATNIGCNIDDLLISQPDYAEQALEVVEQLVSSGLISLIVIDSVAALVPKKELEGDMGDTQVGVQARLMSQALRKLTAIANKTKTTVVFINQIRMKIGTMGYGSPETTTGGNALKFYSSIRIDIRKIGSIKKGEETIGNDVKVKIVKNKVAPPFKTINTKIFFGKGISLESEILELAIKNNIIDKNGAWFSYGEQKLGQGAPNVIELLETNKELFNEIKEKVLKFETPIISSNDEMTKQK